MGQENWQQVKDIFVEVVQQKPEVRQAFLKEACNGDTEIHREVESLLSSFDSADSFLEIPAVVEVAESFVDGLPQFECGQTLKHYEIIRQIGKGGMGEVYLAKDTKLHRQVALKVLHSNLSSEKEGNERLLREARTAATLDHPNICAIYEIAETSDYSFIIMQFVEGETLAEKLENERLGTETSLDLAIQIVDALDEAHTKHIIHRDIKPENIIINIHGKVTVLDFGLAKFIEVQSNEETEKMLSEPGLIMGTTSYMSPEQLRGKRLDIRSDIFSFGAMFYEMLSGRQPFLKETNAETIAAILKSEPPTLNESTPFILQQIVGKALQKKAEKRYLNTKDLLLDLKEAKDNLALSKENEHLNIPLVSSAENFDTDKPEEYETKKQSAVSTHDVISQKGSKNIPFAVKIDDSKSSNRSPFLDIRRKTNFLVLFALTFVVAVLAIGFGSFNWWQSKQQDTNLASSLSVSQFFSWKTDLNENANSSAHFSPDGRLVAFASTKSGLSSIWLKQVSGSEPFTNKEGNWSESNPVFSPDGERIAYISDRGERKGIWVMPTLGGSSEFITALGENGENLLRWSKDGKTIYFEDGINLFGLDLISKQINNLTNLDLRSPAHQGFDISTDGKQIAYVAAKNGKSDLWVISRTSGIPVQVTDDEFEEDYLVWHSDGQRILYSSMRSGISQIFMVRLDGSLPVQLMPSETSKFITAVSPDGSKILYYSREDNSDLWNVRLSDSVETRLTEEIGIEMWADIAADGSAMVFQGDRTRKETLSVYSSTILSQQLRRERKSLQLADDGFSAKWSPDGKQVAFLRMTLPAGGLSLWTVSAKGGDAKRQTDDGVVAGGYSVLPFNRVESQDYQWLPNSRSIIYCARRNGISNLWQVSTDSSDEEQLTQNNNEELRYSNPILSPDNKRIAFSVNERKAKRWSIRLYEEGETNLLYQSTSTLSLVGWSENGQNLIAKTIINTNSKSIYDVGLLQISTDYGAMRHLHQLPETYLQNITLSPDKQMIAYVTRKDGTDSINIISVKGEINHSILKSNDPRVYFASLTWAPDNKSIYYSKQEKWQIISMIDNFK